MRVSFGQILGLAVMPLLVGCVAAWGSSYHFESKDAAGGSIRYDRVLVSEREVIAHANEACAIQGNVAVVVQEQRSVILPGGSVDEITYACKEPIAKIMATNPQFAKDRYECMQESRSNISGSSAVGGFQMNNITIPGSGRSFSREEIDPSLYAACMAAHGYQQ